MKEKDKNPNPNIDATVRGVGCLSEHGQELKRVGRQELQELVTRLSSSYTQDEQFFILDWMSSEISGLLLDMGEDAEDPATETED